MTDSSSINSASEASGLLRSMRKTNPVESKTFAESALDRWPDDVGVRDAVSWIRLDHCFSTIGPETSETQLRPSIEMLATMAMWSPTGPYRTSDATVNCVIEFARNLNKISQPVVALEVLSLLRVSDITDKPAKRFASLRSRWFLEQSRSLELLEQWNLVIETCEEGIRVSTFGRHSAEKIRLRLAAARKHASTAT
jgi:hypothetical protein